VLALGGDSSRRGVAAVLAVCYVCCGPYRLLCGGGVPCGGKHIIIKLDELRALSSNLLA